MQEYGMDENEANFPHRLLTVITLITVGPHRHKLIERVQQKSRAHEAARDTKKT
jgi:hypothetical protein